VPLPPSAPRDALHLRRIEINGYRRHDGLYEVEARIVDTRSTQLTLKHSARGLPAGEPLHDMWLRLVFDEDLVLHDVIAVTDAAPHAICPEAAAAVASLKGERIGAGFNRRVRERLGGATGCTHIVELLGPAATTAFQTLAPLRAARPDVRDATGRPVKIDSCYAYGRSREVVRIHWPAFHEPATD
jgi:hypothetical protein